MTKVSPHSSCMDVWWSWIQDFSDRNKNSWCKQAPCASRLQAALYQCKDAVLPAQNDAASEVRKAAAHTWGRSTNIIKLRVGKPKFYVLQAGLHFTHLPSSLPAHQRQLSVCTCGTKITRALLSPAQTGFRLLPKLTFSSTALGSFTPTSSPLSSAR